MKHLMHGASRYTIGINMPKKKIELYQPAAFFRLAFGGYGEHRHSETITEESMLISVVECASTSIY